MNPRILAPGPLLVPGLLLAGLTLAVIAACIPTGTSALAGSRAQPQEAFYPSYEQIVARLSRLQAGLPDIVQVREIGQSSHGKPILAVKISDNATREEDEPAWLFLSVVHGREPLGLKITLGLIHDLTRGYGVDQEITDWINAYEIWFVPVQNVYGYETNRRKNGDNPGVDLNRNYDFRWDRCVVYQPQCIDPASSYYAGVAPFSEPETRAVRDLALEQRPRFGVDFHQGNPYPQSEIMRPWSTGRAEDRVLPPPDQGTLLVVAGELGRWIADARQQGGFCRSDSPIFDPAVCRAPQMSLLAPMGQSSNWHHATSGTFHYVIEISQRLYNDRYFYTPDPADDDLRSLQQAEEYIRTHTTALREWLRWFLRGREGEDFIYRALPPRTP
ncbi:MAG: zinc carboxypeptidase [Armatimonadetes bacterium]|nr:zinc carboxypeptidase [Armatimonadota bacterium]